MRLAVTITIVLVLAALLWVGWRYSRRLYPFAPTPSTTLPPAEAERISEAIRMYLERWEPSPP